MANHLGSEGVVRIAANTIAEVKSWNIEETSETVEDTVMGDSWRTYKPTLKSWSGSLTCFWDETDTTGQMALVVGTEVALKVYPEGNQTGDKFFEGQAIVTSISRSANFDGMVEASFNFQGNGQLSSPLAP
ncbi:MAG: phage tail tube protein [Rickettsiales bacterium]|nr:phage tail tube protein [Rickettsiales bacterium]